MRLILHMINVNDDFLLLLHSLEVNVSQAAQKKSLRQIWEHKV